MSRSRRRPGPRRVLVIESERLFREAWIAALASDPRTTCVASGADVETVSPGSETASPGTEGDVDVEVVLLSLEVPSVHDPIAHVSAVAARFAPARLVVLSPYVDEELGWAMIEAGARSVLSTSVGFGRLVGELVVDLPGGEPIVEHSTDRDELAWHTAEALGITPRQFEVLRLVAKGASPDHAARALGIAVDTCRDHIKALHRVLDVSSGVEMVVAAWHRGLLPELRHPLRR